MTDEQLTKIRWLGRAFHARHRAAAWIAKYERDKSSAERLSRACGGIGSTPGSGNATESCILRLLETKERMLAEMARQQSIEAEIEAAIDTIDDPDMHAILVRHYLAGQTFEAIAEQIHYDERTIRRKHKAALDRIVLECPAEM